MPADPSLVARLAEAGQGHLLRWWDDLDESGRSRLVAEVGAIDLDEVDALFRQLVHEEATLTPAKVAPVEVDRLPRTDGERVARRHVAAIGEGALAAGEVAVIIVAGGSGTRLGFEGPKGTYPIAPVSAASLFQIHAEKIVALSKRHGRSIPLYVMTSPENHEATARFFAEHGHFGLDHVRFFVQGQMPAVDRESGQILLAEKGRVALSPDGHGGTLYALAAPGSEGSPSCLDEMRRLGAMTDEGWAAWNLEYRRVGRFGGGGGWPATLADVGAALDGLARVPGLDLDRIVTCGHSAGGQLALWAAGRHRLRAGAPGAGPRVRVMGAVALAGVVDLAEGARLGLGDGAVTRFLGGGPDLHPDRYAIASPAELLPLGLRQVLVHGLDDETVPPSMSERYHGAAVAAGDTATSYVPVAGVGHMAVISTRSAAWPPLRDSLRSMLQ